MTESLSATNPLTIQRPENTPSPFLSEEMRSPNRPSAFLTREDNVSNEKSPLTIQRKEDDDKDTAKTTTYPKTSDAILSELRRNAMHSMMTARDIAKEYNIPYSAAHDIFMSLNENQNGVVREFAIPNNSTVSFLV